MVMNKGKNKGVKRSDVPTPEWLCEFLYNLVKDQNFQKVLDPCCGDRRLTKRFDCPKTQLPCEVINYEIKEGTDFLKEDKPIECEFVIINPPFNIGQGRKLSVEVFMDKILELVGKDTPILVITPMGFRLNQRHTSKRYKKVRDTYPPIDTIISLPLDTFEDTLFHTEVIGFNTPFLKPHYFIS
tara:strand:- start:753 stop:1304 length:552 start_codon:yes stop_codon:yes gene_type:complete